MTSSLHVSLPDEMRAYVDLRTNGQKAYATPSEYVRALIRKDMEDDSQRLYIFGELLKSSDDIANMRLFSSDEVEQHMTAFLEELENEDAK
jgi:antitoxin ParD1/3/4